MKTYIAKFVFFTATHDMIRGVMVQVFRFVNIVPDCVRYL